MGVSALLSISVRSLLFGFLLDDTALKSDYILGINLRLWLGIRLPMWLRLGLKSNVKK